MNYNTMKIQLGTKRKPKVFPTGKTLHNSPASFQFCDELNNSMRENREE